MGTEREIRHLNIKDCETAKAVLSVQIPAYKIEAQIIGFDAIPQLFDTAESLMGSDEKFIGMSLEGRLAGILAYEEEDRNWVVISRLTVHPSYFRRGIAKSLLAHLTGEFAGKKMRVLTGKGNMPALRLYKKFGFTEKGELEPEPGVMLAVLEKE
jgi:ribosomal protein S18 acetylase RimI-like enzyme